MSEPLDWARMPYRKLTKDKRAQAYLARWVELHEQAGHRVRKRLDGTEE